MSRWFCSDADGRRTRKRRLIRRERGQSNVVGVAILLAVVVVSLGSLTAAIGAVVDGNAAAADASRVASDLDAALEPVEATGAHRGRVSFTDGAEDDTETGVLAVGAPTLNGSVAVSASGGGSAVLRTTVSHHRTELGEDTYGVAVETATPDAWRRHFERQNATVTTRDFDDDGLVSVVARYPGERVGYLVVHDVRLEVWNG
jgi:flagellin-like protein